MSRNYPLFIAFNLIFVAHAFAFSIGVLSPRNVVTGRKNSIAFTTTKLSQTFMQPRSASAMRATNIVMSSEQDQRKKVMIVGAGPAGLLSAHYLLNRGKYDVTIAERRSDPREVCTHTPSTRLSQFIVTSCMSQSRRRWRTRSFLGAHAMVILVLSPDTKDFLHKVCICSTIEKGSWSPICATREAFRRFAAIH